MLLFTASPCLDDSFDKTLAAAFFAAFFVDAATLFAKFFVEVATSFAACLADAAEFCSAAEFALFAAFFAAFDRRFSAFRSVYCTCFSSTKGIRGSPQRPQIGLCAAAFFIGTALRAKPRPLYILLLSSFAPLYCWGVYKFGVSYSPASEALASSHEDSIMNRCSNLVAMRCARCQMVLAGPWIHVFEFHLMKRRGEPGDRTARNTLEVVGSDIAPVTGWTEENIAAIEAKAPADFMCPITLGIMLEPVVASDGYSYEKGAICELFSKNQTSPMTRAPLQPVAFRNITLQQCIQAWIDKFNRGDQS